MPALKGAEISRAHGVDLELLPLWLAEQCRWDREEPRCAVKRCGQPLHPVLTRLGFDTHPCCAPHDYPDLRRTT